MEPGQEEEKRMSLWEHLDELRSRIVYCLVAVGVVLCGTYYFSEHLVHFLERPLTKLLPPGEDYLYFTGLTDKFFTYLQVSIYSAIFVASPFLLYQVWRFVSPALRVNEKRFLVPFLFLGTFFFGVGLAFAYYLVLPLGYKFLIEFGSSNEKALITLTEYFSLTVKLMLALGLVFELPVVLILLAQFGIVDADMLTRMRRQAIVGIAILSAIITPTPDAFTMILVMVPLWLLYEFSIVAVRWVGRQKLTHAT